MGQLRIFLSYNFQDHAFVREIVQRVGYYLRKQREVEIYLWSEHAKAGNWIDQLEAELENCNAAVVFVSRAIGETQRDEIRSISRLKDRLIVTIVPGGELPEKQAGMIDWGNWARVTYEECNAEPALYAKKILQALRVDWIAPDGLPVDYLFDYERDIIKEYREGSGRISDSFVRRGAQRLGHGYFVMKQNCGTP